MNDQQKPNLVLDTPPGNLNRIARSESRVWLPLLLVLQIMMVAAMALLLMRGNQQTNRVDNNNTLAKELRDLALELENRSLFGEAARSWEQYLESAPGATDKAEILFRVGKMYMQSAEFERAAAAFVRCEQADDAGNLPTTIGQNLVTCLRRLGLHGEVGRELSRQVELGAGDVKQGKVLATLAGEQLTEADLDRMVERRVDQMLSLQGGHSESTRQAILRQFSAPEMRRQIFQELLQTELFTRRARELKLDRDEPFLRARQALEDNLLASQFQARELTKVEPTDVDIEAYYAADPDRYRQPETMQAVVIELRVDEDATKILEEVKTADDFKRLASNRGLEAENATASKIEPRRIVRGQNHFELGTTDSLFELDAGQWTSEPQANGDRRFLLLIESKSPAHTPPLSEIRERVQADYVSRKQQELARKLIEDLMVRYDVKLMSMADEPANDDVVPTNEDPAETDKPSDDEQDAEAESDQ